MATEVGLNRHRGREKLQALESCDRSCSFSQRSPLPVLFFDGGTLLGGSRIKDICARHVIQSTGSHRLR